MEETVKGSRGRASRILLELGLQAWLANKIYIDDNGNYRYVARPRKIVLYNKALKQVGTVEDVHRLAHRKPVFGEQQPQPSGVASDR